MSTGELDGNVLAQDGRKVWKFTLLLVKSDEDVRSNEFGMVHFIAAECCSDCLANASTRPYTDLRKEAMWRPTEEFEFEAWKLRFRQPHHPLVVSPYCCSRFFSSWTSCICAIAMGQRAVFSVVFLGWRWRSGLWGGRLRTGCSR